MSLFSIKHIHHFDDSCVRAFAEIQRKLGAIMIDTSKLLAAVAREKTDNDSLRALVQANTKAMSDLSSQLADAIAKLDAGTDTTALEAVQADLDKATADLSLDSDKTEAALAASVPAQSSAPPAADPTANPAPSTDSSTAQPLSGTSQS
jgi:predicted  nucleic acid-binding Zn-ribbon protein